MAISKDKNGNDVAPVQGGAFDGDMLFCGDAKEGDTWVYGRLHPREKNRSRYRFVDGIWRFDGFDNE